MSSKRTFVDSFDNLSKEHKRRHNTELAAQEPIPSNIADKLRTYGRAHNAVESRVYELEKLARPYQEFEKKTRKGIHLMQQVREEVTSTRNEALNEINQAVDSAKTKYSSHVKKLATSCVELSTNKLASALINRVRDGDVIKGEYLDQLRALIGRESQAEQDIRERRGERMLPSPPSDGEEAAPHAKVVVEPLTVATSKTPVVEPRSAVEMNYTISERVNQDREEATPTGDVDSTARTSICRVPKALQSRDQDDQVDEKTPPAPRRSERYSMVQHEAAEEQDEADDDETSPAPRRSSRAPVPSKRPDEFVSWREAAAWKKSQSRRK